MPVKFSVGDVLRWGKSQDASRLRGLYGEPLLVVAARPEYAGMARFTLEQIQTGKRLDGLFCCELCILDPFLTAVKRATHAKAKI